MGKIIDTSISVAMQSAITVISKTGAGFSSSLHCHPEVELVYIKSGRGKKIIGNQISSFGAGEIVLIGSGLSHRWVPDQSREDSTIETPEAIVSYIHPGVFSDQFYTVQECRKLRDLFEKCKKGIFLTGESRKIAETKIQRLATRRGFKKILGLLDILYFIATSDEITIICNEAAVADGNVYSDRFNEVYQYIEKNFTKDISLEEIAKVAHLTPTAFCRLFKQKTQKPFTTYLNDKRIAYACNLLKESDQSIYQIAGDAGFNTSSNFNKCFRQKVGISPGEYRAETRRLSV
jgi:AraC-like DNA-binding protein